MVQMLVHKRPEIMQLVFNKNTMSFIGNVLLDGPSTDTPVPWCPDHIFFELYTG